MSQLQCIVKGLIVLLVCALLAVLFTTYYQQPITKIIMGEYLTHRAATNNSYKDINITYENSAILNKKSHVVSLSPETRLHAANNNSYKDINITYENSPILNKKSRVVSLSPETRLHTLCDQLNTTDRSRITSPGLLEMKFVKLNNDGAVNILIHTYDMLNRSNTRGDDVIVLWAGEKDGDGRVSGEVIDHKNGSYTGILKLFWSGKTSIKAKLASSIINTCLRMKAMKNYGNAVFAMQQGWGIRGRFENEGHNEISPCGANPTIYGYTNICNLTVINGGMPWYCGKPKNKSLSCSDIYSFGTGKFDTRWASQQERIQNPGHGVFRFSVTINVPLPPRHMSDVPCKDSQSITSWENTVPSGYWHDDAWHMTQCRSEVKQTFAEYRKCLSGKTIIIIGDSTLRQYADYILKHIMGIDISFDQASVGQYHNFTNMYTAHGITLRYLRHEMPFHNPRLPSLEIQSTPQLLDAIAAANITDLVVVVNYNIHFTAYPPFVYRHCQRELSKALRRLSIANPSAKLFVKKPHLVIADSRWFDPHIQLLDTEMLREEFSDVYDKIILLDAWTISVAHNSERIHPEGKALRSQMYQFISYLC